MSKHKKMNPNCKVCDEEGYLNEVNPYVGNKIKVPHLCMPDLESNVKKNLKTNKILKQLLGILFNGDFPGVKDKHLEALSKIIERINE